MNKTNRVELRSRLPRIRTALPDYRLLGAGATDVGLRREANEDSFLLLPKNGLWIVADGMGGHAGGQVASALTVLTCGDAILRRLAQAEERQRAGGGRINVAAVLDAGVREACALVFDTARERPELTGMGSTVTLMLVYGSFAWFAHVGDSRAYLLRDDVIHQVTEDHSLVQEQVAAGLITPEQARVSVMRNIITRSIGFERDVKVDIAALPLAVGDRFMLCSDGLTGHVEDATIRQVMRSDATRVAPQTLVDLANAGGGEDNSTVVVVEVKGTRGRQRTKRTRRSA
ncbi:MAG: PP2C family serine/threonine-protein phosphatase [bacterium]